MNFKNLAWDSFFFDCSVVCLNIDDNCSLGELKDFCAGQQSFDVCYIFNHSQTGEFDQYLTELGAVLYDQKVTFCKTLSQAGECSVSEVVELTSPTQEIIALAISSGINSRFYLDPHFRSKQSALYERWIMNCFENPNGKVFGIYRSGILAAVAGATFADQGGHLELIAVDSRFRRLGMAKKLIDAVENFYADNSNHYAEIITQKNNLPACATYKACGYSLKECVEIWHLWKTNLQNRIGDI